LTHSTFLFTKKKERKKEREREREEKRTVWVEQGPQWNERTEGKAADAMHDSKTTLAAVLRTAKVREGERVHRKPTVDRQLQEGLVSAT